MIKIKFQKTKEGNIIVPIIRGHLVIPITDKRFELFSDYQAELTQKDFEEKEGTWDSIFKNLYNDKISKYDLMLIIDQIPDIIYRKFKKDEKKIFQETDFMKICIINLFKNYPKKGEVTLIVNMDLLKEYPSFKN